MIRLSLIRMAILLVGMGLLHPEGAPAGNDSTAKGKTLTLKTAIQIALENNPGYRAMHQATRAAQWGVKKAYFDFLPKVAIHFNYSRLDAGTVHRANIFTEIGRNLVQQFAPGTDPNEVRPAAWRNAYGTSVTLQQPIFNGGALKAQLNMAQANESQTQYSFFEKRQETILNTMAAFYGVLKANEFLALAQRTLSATEAKLASTRRMFENGLRNRAEVLRWEVALASDRGQWIEAKNNAALARARLAQVLGINIDSTYTFKPEPYEPEEKLQPLEYYLELGRRRNPSVSAFSANLDLQQSQIQLARSNFFPKVNLIYNYQWETNNTLALDSFKTWTFGIGVNIPLFNSFADYAKLQEARARFTQMQHAQEEFLQGLALQIRQAYLNVQSAAQRVKIAKKGAELAEENLRVINNTFSVGMAANIDLIDARVAATRAQANLIQARFDYLLSMAQLKKATGTLDK